MVRMKDAILASFHEPAPSVRARLAEFSSKDWNRAKHWLDVSGLALYFLDRMLTLNLDSCLPIALLNQLQKDLADNQERTASLFREAAMLTCAFQRRNVEFALLKGITLPSESVPCCALRSQMDLDVLVRESDAHDTKNCLEEFGYALEAVSGNTWEFKAGMSGKSSLKNLYQVRSERAVDVHLIPKTQGQIDRLERAERRPIAGQTFPALSSADLFVLQGQHIFKHMCGEHTRASWVLEYWRHVCARRNDLGFWSNVELIAAQEPGADVAIGAATLLASLVFGTFAPQELQRWSTDRVPSAICLWIQRYGRPVLLSDSPGSKLYLLLLKELDPDSKAKSRARRQLLFPTHLPPRITRPEKNERLAVFLRRQCAEMLFVIRRLRFHLLGGVSFAIESLRWHRRITDASR